MYALTLTLQENEIIIDGSITTHQNVADLEKLVKTFDESSTVLLNCEKIDILGSLGINSLVKMSKRFHGLALKNVPDYVIDTFKILKITNLLRMV